ncbi:MAG: DUF3307 domain-containing protein [Paracoccaceae bacterium]
MNEFILLMIVGLELKHFVADYLLQFDWMIKGKGSVSKLGGYFHAAVHAGGSFAVLVIAALPTTFIIVMVIAEFAVHYMLDFGKVHYSKDVSSVDRPRLFWALNGLDQLFHHLTYVVMTYIVVLFVAN